MGTRRFGAPRSADDLCSCSATSETFSAAPLALTHLSAGLRSDIPVSHWLLAAKPRPPAQRRYILEAPSLLYTTSRPTYERKEELWPDNAFKNTYISWDYPEGSTVISGLLSYKSQTFCCWLLPGRIKNKLPEAELRGCSKNWCIKPEGYLFKNGKNKTKSWDSVS